MENQFERTEYLIGKAARMRLSDAHVAVFGIGGVGGFVCEALARAGIGTFTLVDGDEVDITNLNRQITALHSTIGKEKAAVMKERILDINPETEVRAVKTFFVPENSSLFDFSEFDYIVDAVDTVTAKIELILCAGKAGVPIISSMGTGNKLDPSAFRVADIYETAVCPLARVMRKELRARGIKNLKVVYSEEIPQKMNQNELEKMFEAEEIVSDAKTYPPSSISFVPPAAGLILAGEVIKDLIRHAG